uniref:Uncharacterized protein n=1 Tax=Cyprinus carpio TaxID=7962 RepID=A0A8C1SD93_CYPCA
MPLSTHLDNARNLSNILKAISFRDHLQFPLHPRLSTLGYSGNAHYDYPKDSDMMELFQCTKIQTNRYKMSLLKPSTKALALSYLVRNDDGQICFVEYYCCPDEEE